MLSDHPPMRPIRRRQFLRASAALATAGLLPGRSVRADQSAPTASRIKILLDTDIGSDIDDALALAYLLMQPNIECLGITTVTGEPSKRAALAKRLSDLAGATIPIRPGFATPRSVSNKQPRAPQASKLPNTYLQNAHKTHDPEAAVDLMATAIRRNPAEVTLLAVGPFTTVARLLEREPGISRLLKQLVIMGGKYSDYPTPWGDSEWNGIVDPEATDILFRKIECPIRAFGLDITWQVSMNAAEVSRSFAQHPLLEEIKNWSEVWFAERERLHFHDPIAAISIIDPTICTYQEGQVHVDLSADRAGFTDFSALNGSEGSPYSRHSLVEVATSVDRNKVFDRYFAAFQ